MLSGSENSWQVDQAVQDPPKPRLNGMRFTMILGLHHIALATFDIKRIAFFYRDAFDFRIVKQGGWERDSLRHEQVTGLKGSAALTWMLQCSNLFLELFQYIEPPGQQRPRGLCDPGLSHFCFAVTDIDAEFSRLERLGMTFHGPPPGEKGDAVRAIYGADPDGNVIELLQHQPGAEHVYHAALLGLQPS